MKLNQVSAALGIAAMLLKVYADFQRHKTHTSHNQLCDCLSMCYSCLFDEVKASVT